MQRLEVYLALEAEKFGTKLNQDQLQKFLLYLSELKKWNKKVNLTALKDDLDILVKHFLDSLLPLRFIPPNSSLLDIGSGAGFPGIPLKIAEPTLKVTLMDSSFKKVIFLRHIIRTLGLKDIHTLHAHAEKMRMGEDFLYEVIISRALYDPLKLQSVSKRYLKKGGRLIILTTPRRIERKEWILDDSFQLKEVLQAFLPMAKGERRILYLEKI